MKDKYEAPVFTFQEFIVDEKILASTTTDNDTPDDWVIPK